MKILSLSFTDKNFNWKLENSEFQNLTLLVGASGVGKTKILNAILDLKNITNGKSIAGISWLIKFQDVEKNVFEWEGEFEKEHSNIYFKVINDELKKPKSRIISERITKNGKSVARRNGDDSFLNRKKIVKLSREQSLVNLLKEEEDVKPIFESFKKIIFSDQVESKSFSNSFYIFALDKLKRQYKTLKSIQEGEEPIPIKLALLYSLDKKSFDKTIKEKFLDIFPQITDIKIEPDASDTDDDMPPFLKEVPMVQLKEAGVQDWITQPKISSGMFRSLMQISEIYLCSEGSVILIDEFENSLGVNCIDELTDELLRNKRNIQFILTSHHPYIINHISPASWKLVTRKKGVVRTHSASEFNIGNSKHEAFIQLINLDEYKTGIEL